MDAPTKLKACTFMENALHHLARWQNKLSSVLLVVIALSVVELLLVPQESGAIIAGGGGSKRNDCLGVLDGPFNFPAARPRNIRCADGDPCDSDGMVNGVCELSLTYCANSTDASVSECTIMGVESIVVDHAIDNGDPKFDPEFQALQDSIDNDILLPTAVIDQCATASSIRVTIKGPFANNKCRRNTKRVRITTESILLDGRSHRDRDTIRIICEPATVNGCDPQTLYTSTFERVQRQILNQSCALSSCHDSETQAGSLLLEAGASLSNLIDIDPSNGSAFAAGWKRIEQLSPTSGDPDLSFLFRKIEDDLPDNSFGKRMPRNQARLRKIFREIIELWILDGAPSTGWVPGTF